MFLHNIETKVHEFKNRFIFSQRVLICKELEHMVYYVNVYNAAIYKETEKIHCHQRME